MSFARLAILAALLLSPLPVMAQKKKAAPLQAPEPGYLFPPGGKIGTTVEAQIGGFDWTPDVQYFSLDSRIKLDVSGELGPILVPPPPYWFGAKAYIAPLPLPRERLAKLTIPAGMPIGPVRWTTASASGAGAKAGTFWIGEFPEILEAPQNQQPQKLAALPSTVNGRLSRVEEVDRYQFSVPKNGLVSCEMIFRRLGVNANAVLTVRDSSGAMIVDAVDSTGSDTALTFAAKANEVYTISVNDLDFRGDRSYVYRLNISPGPRVVGTIPARLKRGESRNVEFVGYGIATGKPVLESVTRQVSASADAKLETHAFRLETAFGIAPTFSIPLSDSPETVIDTTKPQPLTIPASVTGVLSGPTSEAKFLLTGKKGDIWDVTADARRYGSPLDLSLAIANADGKEVAKNDDLPGTTDSGLSFTVPADGTYTVTVSDISGNTGNRAAIFHLNATLVKPDFTLSTVVRLNAPVGEATELSVKVARIGGFKEPITLKITGLPNGVSVPDSLVIPGDKLELKIPFTVAENASAEATFITITGTAGAVTRTASAPLVGNMAVRSPDFEQTNAVLLATTLTPRLKLVAVEADGGRRVHRGSTHPAEVIIERLNGFDGEVSLQMSAAQSYQRQGITGPDMTVPAKDTRAFYPCFMPEWLETTRTSRMELIGVVKVPDAKGRIRFLATPMSGRITMHLEGAILKVDSPVKETRISAGNSVDIPINVSRSVKLAEPVKLELRAPDELSECLRAEAITVPPGKTQGTFRITCVKPVPPGTEHEITIRGIAIQDGKYTVMSETTITLLNPPTK